MNKIRVVYDSDYNDREYRMLQVNDTVVNDFQSGMRYHSFFIFFVNNIVYILKEKIQVNVFCPHPQSHSISRKLIHQIQYYYVKETMIMKLL